MSAAKSTALYDVEIYPDEPVAGQWEDERPDPLVRGRIRLTDDDVSRLRRRLTAMQEDEVIGVWYVGESRPDKEYTLEGIVQTIARQYESAEDVTATLAQWDEVF